MNSEEKRRLVDAGWTWSTEGWRPPGSDSDAPMRGPEAILARARELLSPRARSGLAALPAEQQATTASAVASGEHLESWDRHLSQGQPWPDTIEGTP